MSAAVTVVGAGPAGLAAAIVLAKGGRDVELHEWHRHVGARFHGDFQGLENWSCDEDTLCELQSWGIDINFLAHPVRTGTGFDARGRRHEISARRPLYYLVERGGSVQSLEYGLLKQAEALGVRVHFGSRVRETEGETILAGGPRKADIIASGYVFETECEDGAYIAFDDRLAPRGYAYLLVHQGRGTIAACLFRGFKRQQEFVERTCDFFREKVGLVMRNEQAFGGYGNLRLPRSAVQGRHPVAGEHAGFQDALAGFGLRYSITSGALAAQSILENRSYEQLWRRLLLPRMKAGIVNRFVFNSIGTTGRHWVTAKLMQASTGERLHKLYAASSLHAMLFPAAERRLRRGLHDPSCDHQDCTCVWCEHGTAF